jgi:MFS family permease
VPVTIDESTPLPNPYKGHGTTSDPYLVDWLPDERANPYNWSSAYRWMVTFVIAVSALCVAFASSSYSAAIQDLHREFPNMGQEEGIAGLSLYVLGFGIGPLIWAPVSELYGRNVAFFASYPLFCMFNMGGALSRNVPSILVFRLLAGTFGAAPLVTAGGQVGDMWALHERALATSLFSIAPFLGPVLGPLASGFLAEKLGWRAVFWTQCIFAVVMCTASFLLVPETYAPTLLKRKAKQLMKEATEQGTGEVFISKFDVVRKSKREVIVTGLCRPFAMIAKELIVFCLGLYGESTPALCQ